jgi:ABC-type multidrug transport system ATPase subunit
MGTEPVVKLNELTVRYGKLTAIDDVSLEVPKGGVFALLGRNGSGKSSTVRCLLGQQQPTAGRSQILGFDSWKKRRQAMERVGVVPENPDVPPDTTADRVEKFMARVTPFWRSAAFFDRLESLGVPREQRFARLSKGQQRQLALALALAGSPRLLVLDDPTLGLDAVARRNLYEELVGELADRGTTVFLTTHDLAGVEGIADQIGVLHGGSLLVDEKLDVLKARFCRQVWTANDSVPRERIEAGLRHLGPVGAGVAQGENEAVVENFSEFGFDRFRQEAPVEVMRVDSLSLEEIFVDLCGAEPGGRS